MNRRHLLWGLSGLAGCSPAKRTLNVLNWSVYVAPDTIPTFEKEFGVRVNYSSFESNEELLAKVTGGRSGWDVVFPTNYFIPPMRSAGLLAPLDGNRLSNLDNLGPRFRRPEWDPDLRYSVPYMWGATGIAYQAGAAPVPGAWASLWEERWKGRLTMLDDPAEAFAAALKKLSFSLNSEDGHQLRLAQKELIDQKKLLRAYLNAEVRDQLVSGDVLAAQLWTTTAGQAMGDSENVRFAFPVEGFPLYVDTMAILAESRQRELAHEFLNYLLRPQVAADIASHTVTSTANAKAYDLLPEKILRMPSLYPPPEVLERGEWFRSLSPSTQQLRDRLWTEIKNA